MVEAAAVELNYANSEICEENANLRSSIPWQYPRKYPQEKRSNVVSSNAGAGRRHRR